MPNYEPTPRRFSVISVSQSASRRNSIDDVARPSVAPITPRLPKSPSPIDLASALKRLQHVEAEVDVERGRTRLTGWDRAGKAVSERNGEVATPSFRRDSSASTRDRIAMWEARSRSRSKGRSKSRGRDIGPKSRISVVPEIPELTAAFAAFSEKEESLEKKGVLGTETEGRGSKLPSQRQSIVAMVADPYPNDNIGRWEQGVLEEHLRADTGTEDGMKNQTVSDLPWETDSRKHDNGSQMVNSMVMESKGEMDDARAIHRPCTPPNTCPEFPLTLDSISRPKSRSPPAKMGSASNHVAAVPGDTTKLWTGPRTPSPQRAQVHAMHRIALPLTPEATPKQLKNRPDSMEAKDAPPAGAVESIQTGTLLGKHIPVFPPKEANKEQGLKGDSLVRPGGPDGGYDLPTPPSFECLDRQRPFLEPETQAILVSRVISERAEPQAISGASVNVDMQQQPRYHSVWRINSYQPDFPLPSRPPDQEYTRAPGDTRFDGNPLQSLPRSRTAEEPVSLGTSESLNPYPYAAATEPDAGDWIITIPPSPSAAYVPAESRNNSSTRRSRSRNQSPYESGRHINYAEARRHAWDPPPVIERALHAASVSMIQGLNVPVELYRGIRDTYYPLPNRPDIIKAYPIRKRLPVRIFFPSHHDLTSPALLPTLFTIHGGAFTFGHASDDDPWNRAFADTYTVLIISLNYSKSPWSTFPSPLLDIEALYHAALNDESLPIDRMRTAIAGFDAGGNLALALCQLPSVKSGRNPNPHPHPNSITESNYAGTSTTRCNPPPAAVVSVCGMLDFTTSAAEKLATRPYKRQLRGPRGWGPALDWMGRLVPSSAWSYIPYGHDAADPLLSPVYADREELVPLHVMAVAAELDCLANESWRAACRWAGGGKRVVPGRQEVVGRNEVSLWRGCLDDGREKDSVRFGWEEDYDDGGGAHGSTKWLLVPDVVHGFDSAGWRGKYLWADEIARMDAEMKTIAYQREMAEWLWGTVWR